MLRGVVFRTSSFSFTYAFISNISRHFNQLAFCTWKKNWHPIRFSSIFVILKILISNLFNRTCYSFCLPIWFCFVHVIANFFHYFKNDAIIFKPGKLTRGENRLDKTTHGKLEVLIKKLNIRAIVHSAPINRPKTQEKIQKLIVNRRDKTKDIQEPFISWYRMKRSAPPLDG